MQNQNNSQSESASRVLVPNNSEYRRGIKRAVESLKRLRNLDRIPKGISPNCKEPKFTPTIQTLHYFKVPLRGTDGDRRSSQPEPTPEETV